MHILHCKFTDSEISNQKIYCPKSIESLAYNDICELIKSRMSANIVITSVEIYHKASNQYYSLQSFCQELHSSPTPSAYLKAYCYQNIFSLLIYTQSNTILSLKGRNFYFSNGFQINSHKIRINEIEQADLGTGLKIWDSAVILSKYIELNPSLIANKRILELGAGTGLCGIACGIIGCRRIILTDLIYALPNIAHNIELNKDSYPIPDQGYIESRVCDWCNPATYPIPAGNSGEASTEDTEWDIIIGADILWLEFLAIPLPRTIYACSSRNTVVYFSHQTRSEELDKIFFNEIEKDFTIELISRDSLPSEFQYEKVKLFKFTLRRFATTADQSQ